jgi:1,4-alpha-glucan branching enzyme
MPKKMFKPSQNKYRVTFTLPAEAKAGTACLCGDFNAWDKTSHPMEKQEDGSFKLILDLEAGRHYQFRYLLDGDHWENDWAADAYVPNAFGSEDSVLILEAPSK